MEKNNLVSSIVIHNIKAAPFIASDVFFHYPDFFALTLNGEWEEKASFFLKGIMNSHVGCSVDVY